MQCEHSLFVSINFYPRHAVVRLLNRRLSCAVEVPALREPPTVASGRSGQTHRFLAWRTFLRPCLMIPSETKNPACAGSFAVLRNFPTGKGQPLGSHRHCTRCSVVWFFEYLFNEGLSYLESLAPSSHIFRRNHVTPVVGGGGGNWTPVRKDCLVPFALTGLRSSYV